MIPYNPANQTTSISLNNAIRVTSSATYATPQQQQNYSPRFVCSTKQLYDAYRVNSADYIKTAKLHGLLYATIPEILPEFTNLTNLDLSNNLLRSLPDTFTQLKHLDELDLSSNLFTQFPPQLFALTSLDHLVLGDNQIIDIPREITKLTNLSILNLDKNQISNLPAEFAQLTSLEQLHISENNFTHFPSQICKLNDLQHLSIKSNQITSIDDKINNLEYLVSFNISNNPIKSLPELKHSDLDILIFTNTGIDPCNSQLLYTDITTFVFGPTLLFICDNNDKYVIKNEVHTERGAFIEYIKCHEHKKWRQSIHKYSSSSTKSTIGTVLTLSLKSDGAPKFAEASFYKLPREILLEIFAWLPFYDDRDIPTESWY